MAMQMSEIADAVKKLQAEFNQNIRHHTLTQQNLPPRDDTQVLNAHTSHKTYKSTFTRALTSGKPMMPEYKEKKASPSTSANDIEERDEDEVQFLQDAINHDNDIKNLRPKPHHVKEGERWLGRYIQDSEGFLHRASKNNRHATGNLNQNVKNKRNPTIRGTKKGTALRVIPPRRKIFVTNLHADTSAEDVTTYVKTVIEENDEDLSVERIQSRNPASKIASFVINCHKRHYDLLLLADSWEEDTRVRPFYPARTPRNGQQRDSQGSAAHETLTA